MSEVIGHKSFYAANGSKFLTILVVSMLVLPERLAQREAHDGGLRWSP